MSSTLTISTIPPAELELETFGNPQKCSKTSLNEQQQQTTQRRGNYGESSTPPESLRSPPRDMPAESASSQPMTNIVKLKLLSCCLCFLVAGLNDGCFGALLPYVLKEYNISTGLVGVIHATNFAGWAVAALIMPIAMAYTGLKGTLMLGAVSFMLAQVLRIWVPPFPLFAVTFFLVSLGQAFQDAQANTFVASLTTSRSHLWLGFIHAMYSLGLLISPPMATAIATSFGEEKERWVLYYSVPLGVGLLNIASVGIAFFHRGHSISNIEHSIGLDNRLHSEHENSKGKLTQVKQEFQETVKAKAVWLISLFYFFHLGAVFTIANWIVLFLTDIRGLSLSRAGYVPTGYYAGVLLGRLILPHPTHTLLNGERNMLLVYTAIICSLQLISWLVNSAITTAVTLSIMGFFFGPFFAAGMQVASEVIPRKIRGSGLGLVFVIAQLGGSIFPAITGAMAESKGVEVLQPLALALLCTMGVAWWIVPKAPKPRDSDRDNVAVGSEK